MLHSQALFDGVPAFDVSLYTTLVCLKNGYLLFPSVLFEFVEKQCSISIKTEIELALILKASLFHSVHCLTVYEFPHYIYTYVHTYIMTHVDFMQIIYANSHTYTRCYIQVSYTDCRFFIMKRPHIFIQITEYRRLYKKKNVFQILKVQSIQINV